MAVQESQVDASDIRVFVSYSHKDDAWKDLVVTFLMPLVHEGNIVLWDDRRIGTGDDWYPAIKAQIEKANIAVCLISENYLESDFINKEEIPAMKRRRADEGMLLLPLLIGPCAWKTVKWLKGVQMFPRDDVSLEEIRTQVQRKKTLADFVVEIHEKITNEDFTTPASVPEFALPEKVDISRLPETGVQLFGRDRELQLLDDMWDSGSAHIVSLVAWGGVGKSTLVNQWLRNLKADNYRGAKRVYGWSFYSQGTGQRATSADQFISETLKWFDDPDPAQGSPWDKGERLARLIRQQRTLLVLDGLEPMQSGFSFDKGKINDPALSVLVTGLAKDNAGLCVITTREKVADLQNYIHVDLEHLSKEAARALLRIGGVRGSEEDLVAAAEAFGNHALAISLLATYLHEIEGHHVSRAASIPDLDIADAEGRHPRRMIEAFHTRFGDGPPTQVLRIMGLFDRPPDLALVNAVKTHPPIPGLTDSLQRLTETRWGDVLDRLRGCKLLAPKSKHNPSVLDCHPLIREYFADKLRREQPDA
ncbi:MAG: toll/interleukin-1 receptor domain-containing protein [Phycisphaerales bacterium]